MSQFSPKRISANTWETPNVLYLLLPATTVTSLALLLPFLLNLYRSQFSGPPLAPLSNFSYLKNYETVISDPSFWASLNKGILYGLGSAILQILLGLYFAIALHRHAKLRPIFHLFALLLVLTPPAAYVACVRVLFDATHGILTNLLSSLLGWDFVLFHETRILAVASIITATQYFPITYLLFAERIRLISNGLINQSSLDNLSPVQRLAVLTLPNLLAPLAGSLLIRFAITFGKFDVIYFLAGNSALHNNVETTTLYIFSHGYHQGYLGVGFAASNILLCLVLFLILLVHSIPPSDRVNILSRHIPFLSAAMYNRPQNAFLIQTLARISSAPAPVLFLTFTLSPIAIFALASISSNFPNGFGDYSLESYSTLFIDYRFGAALRTSVLISLSTTTLAVMFASPLVFLLQFYQFPFKRSLSLLSASAYLVPVVYWVFASRALLTGLDWIPATAKVSISLMGFLLPLATLYFRTAASNLDLPPPNRSACDPVSPVKFFFLVYLKGHSVAIGLAFLFCFAAAWSDYLYASLLGAPHIRTGVIAFQEILHGAVVPWGVLMAAAVVLTTPILGILLIYYRIIGSQQAYYG